jgi:hypothetical protein
MEELLNELDNAKFLLGEQALRIAKLEKAVQILGKQLEEAKNEEDPQTE